ncbi:hypothetical protein CICLE_v10033668mg, partial [Citrus x clementina]
YVKHRSLTAASICGMLGMFQNVSTTSYSKQELSHESYQDAAACRVIARLKKERDEAWSLLAQSERQVMLVASTAITSNATLSNGKSGSFSLSF